MAYVTIPVTEQTTITLPRRAWTGGDTPTKTYSGSLADCQSVPFEPRGIGYYVFRKVRSEYFRGDLKACGGLDLWACAGTSPLARARIFWNAATLDAWRTLLPNGRTK
jgi:hypothetical protein